MIFPKAPPIPVMMRIGAACLIPFVTVVFINSFRPVGISAKAKTIPIPSALVGLVRNCKYSKPGNVEGANFNTVPAHIKIMGAKIGSIALVKLGNWSKNCSSDGFSSCCS